MADLKDIEEQIKRSGASKSFLTRREIKSLPGILWEDENVEKIAQGYYAKGTGILVATNKRLVFIDKGMIYGLRVEDFPYDKISSIQYETGLMSGKIVIFTSGNKAEIKHVYNDQARMFGDYVRARITKVQEHASQSRPDQGLDVAEQIEKLAMLKEKGHLTEHEFTAKKKQLLGL